MGKQECRYRRTVQLPSHRALGKRTSLRPGAAEPPQLWIVEDDKDGPRPPERFELDAAAVRVKLAEIERHTALAKFRFGSPGYDRWAVVYGRIETRKGEDARQAPANLVICGTAVIVFLNAE